MKFVVLLVVFASTGMVQASEFGYTFYGSNLSVDDPDGSANSASYLAPFNGFFADTLKRDLRYQVEIFTDNVTLEGGVNQVGQKVKYQGLGLSLQRRFRLSSNIKPWLGLGVESLSVEYSERHTRDKDGFLDSRFPDRDESAFNLIFNATNYWRFSRAWDMGVVAKAGVPVASDATFLSIGVSAVYR